MVCPLVQFALLTRSGKAKGALVRSPNGSPPIIGVNGMPVRARMMFVNDHPRSGSAHFPKRLSGDGRARFALALNTLRTSKSDGARLNLGSKNGGDATELLKLDPEMAEELSSMLLDQV